MSKSALPGTEAGTRAGEPPPPDPGIERIVDAAHTAVRAALRKHKLLGYPIAVWRDGRVTWIPPEQIEL